MIYLLLGISLFLISIALIKIDKELNKLNERLKDYEKNYEEKIS